MSGDSKIGPVGGVFRAAPLRKPTGEEAAPMAAPTAMTATPSPLPATRLTSLASRIAEHGAPIDSARVATLRNAIAGGSYGPDPAIIARAMTEFYQAGNI